MSPKEIAFDAAVEALETLHRKHFTNAVKLSFVMHHPTEPECYMVVTSDLDGLEAAVRRTMVQRKGRCATCGRTFDDHRVRHPFVAREDAQGGSGA